MALMIIIAQCNLVRHHIGNFWWIVRRQLLQTSLKIVGSYMTCWLCHRLKNRPTTHKHLQSLPSSTITPHCVTLMWDKIWTWSQVGMSENSIIPLNATFWHLITTRPVGSQSIALCLLADVGCAWLGSVAASKKAQRTVSQQAWSEPRTRPAHLPSIISFAQPCTFCSFILYK